MNNYQPPPQPIVRHWIEYFSYNVPCVWLCFSVCIVSLVEWQNTFWFTCHTVLKWNLISSCIGYVPRIHNVHTTNTQYQPSTYINTTPQFIYTFSMSTSINIKNGVIIRTRCECMIVSLGPAMITIQYTP